MANYYNNGGFSNKKTNYGSGGLIYNPAGFTQTAQTISVRTMRDGDQTGTPTGSAPTGYGPGDDEIPFSPFSAPSSTYYGFPAIDQLWDPDTDLGFVVTVSDSSATNISNSMSALDAGGNGTTVLLDYAPPSAQSAVSWSVHMFYGQPSTFSGFYNFHNSTSPATSGTNGVTRASFAIRGGCVGGQIRPDFYSFYNKNMNFQPSPSSVPQTWPVSVGTRGVVLSYGWLDDDPLRMGITAEMDAMLISTFSGFGTPGSSSSLGVGYKIFNSPAGGTFTGSALFTNLGGNSDQASSGSMFIPVPLLGNKTYTGTTQPKRSGIWDVGASYRAKFEGPKEKRTKVAREYTLSTPIVYNPYVNSYETIKFSPDGKSLYGTSNVYNTGVYEGVMKVPLANAWDLSSINMAGFSQANIYLGSGLSSLNTRDALTISNDGKSVALSVVGLVGGSSYSKIVSVPLDTPYDILSANTNVIIRSMVTLTRIFSAPRQILQNGLVVKMGIDYDISSPESSSYYENYRGFSNYPYGGINSTYASYVPASRNWNSYKYSTQGSTSNPPPDVDKLIFSDDGRYSVYPNPTSNVISVLKLRTPFDISTFEIYDQIEFSNINGIFSASSNMINNSSQYKVFHYDQENDKIFLYRQIYGYAIINNMVSFVEIS